MSLDLLRPLLGRWSGEALVTTPDHELRLRHHEEVELHALGTVLTLEGTSHRPEGGDPVFGALAVVTVEDGEVRLRAFQGGYVQECPFDVGPGRYAWWVPGPDGTRIDYRAAFDAERWTEIGTRPDGTETFRMTLTRADGGAAGPG